MATRSVRFDFKCDGGSKKLQYTHKVPAALVRADAGALQTDPTYMQLFVQTIQPLVQQHEAACRGASSRQCENCGQPTVKTLMTPGSWLHNVADPFLNVWVTAACYKGPCEIQLRQSIQTTMQMVAASGESGGSGPEATVELLPCLVCGKTDETKRCARCKVVAYCGREHQKADWASHKQNCAPK